MGKDVSGGEEWAEGRRGRLGKWEQRALNSEATVFLLS